MPQTPAHAALAPGLYIVASPIGNLEDLTLRAIRILRLADLVACEDTRVTATLLRAAGSDRPMLAWHDHSTPGQTQRLVERMRTGAVALVTDAGTPGVSDPGFALVRAALEAGIAVTTAPGPSAVIAALSVAGLPMDEFHMGGFLPRTHSGRRSAALRLAPVPGSLVLFETGPRLAASLAVLADVLGDRPAAVCRELTKRYEEVVRGTLSELAARYAAAPPPRGELVLVVGPGSDTRRAAPDLDAALARALETALETMPPGRAAASVAAALGVPRATAYERALVLARRGREGDD